MCSNLGPASVTREPGPRLMCAELPVMVQTIVVMQKGLGGKQSLLIKMQISRPHPKGFEGAEFDLSELRSRSF